jgi:calcineurin-like phosphoesterase family protein
MSEIYLSSDLHLFHNRDFIYKERGFSSIDEMNKEILNNWNTTINKDDIVYILGDIILQGDRPLEDCISFFKNFNGKKYLIVGNHDSNAKIEAFRKDNIFEDIQFGYRIRCGKRHFFLSHYPTIVSNKDNPKKVYNLCGHTHTKDCFLDWQYKCYHVELDAHNNYPISLNKIIEDIKEREKNER